MEWSLEPMRAAVVKDIMSIPVRGRLGPDRSVTATVGRVLGSGCRDEGDANCVRFDRRLTRGVMRGRMCAGASSL